ncbi:hypothetical protein [Streptomyces sp. NPDC005408]|uniref:hypothetical protein n=1 Tax=Streptomyces sp. NPDC005408 TaxID=3155341 RepID=UPI0033A3C34E
MKLIEHRPVEEAPGRLSGRRWIDQVRLLGLECADGLRSDVTGIFDAVATTLGDPSDTSGRLKLYIDSTPQVASPHAGLTSLAQGRGVDGGSFDHYLPGSLDRLRIWSGAMSADGLWHVPEPQTVG